MIALSIPSTRQEVGEYRANSFAFTGVDLFTKPKKNNLTVEVLSTLHSNFTAVVFAVLGLVGSLSCCFSSSTLRVLLLLHLSAIEIL